MSEVDRRIIEGLKYLKDELGVSYSHIGKMLGVSPTVFQRYLKGETQVIGFEKKGQLLKIIDEYRQVKF